jgi:hypothetical protein
MFLQNTIFGVKKMKEKCIFDIVKTLTDDELVLHRDLIDECNKREYDNKKHFHQIKQNLQKLNKIVYKIQGDFNIIVDESKKINLALTPTKNKEIH